jgi:Putative beta-barrel porin-2, OmpL-like. bbp2
LTESYYIWERNALQGGTVTNGPPQPFFESVGPGKFLPGISDSFGLVNYTPYKLSDKSYVVLRNDVLYDPRGFRTGVPGTVAEVTLGFIYHITPWAVTRPEIRFDYGTAKVYDNSTKRDQFTFNWDIIVRF